MKSEDMNQVIPIDSTPYRSQHLPFANELEVQQFVEENAENIFRQRLKVISSSRRDGGVLCKIDILAIDAANRPFIIECKWDLVNSGAIRQLDGYKTALQANWSLFEKRVSETRGQHVTVKRREPVLVAIGYRYEPSVLNNAQSVDCLTYAYHPTTLTADGLEEQRPGEVSIHRARQLPMPTSRHPRVSKKKGIIERLSQLPPALQTAFGAIHKRLLTLDAVTAAYIGKHSVRYQVPRGGFAKAKIGLQSIEWQCGNRKDGRQVNVEMGAGSEVDTIFTLLRKAHRAAVKRPIGAVSRR
jgi:hypothetical protein